jgi:hypothetical protein
VLCVVRWRSLRRNYHSSRELLQSVVWSMSVTITRIRVEASQKKSFCNPQLECDITYLHCHDTVVKGSALDGTSCQRTPDSVPRCRHNLHVYQIRNSQSRPLDVSKLFSPSREQLKHKLRDCCMLRIEFPLHQLAATTLIVFRC